MGSTMATTANTESTNITQKHCASESAVFLRAGRSAYHRHITRLKEGISSNAEQNQQQQEKHTR